MVTLPIRWNLMWYILYGDKLKKCFLLELTVTNLLLLLCSCPMKMLIKVVEDNFVLLWTISSICLSTINTAEIAKKSWDRKFFKKKNWFFGGKIRLKNFWKFIWNLLKWMRTVVTDMYHLWRLFFIKDKNKKNNF